VVYEVQGAVVLDMVDRQAPPHVRGSFYDDALIPIIDAPRPEMANPAMRDRILPFQGPNNPDTYTVPFLDGLLLYEVDDATLTITLLDTLWT
jgi:hypothetical protein